MRQKILFTCSLCEKSTILVHYVSLDRYKKYEGPDNIRCMKDGCEGIAIRFKPPSNHGNTLAMEINAKPNPYGDGKK